MKVKLKTEELDAIQYSGNNADACMALIGSQQLTKAIGGNLLYLDMSTNDYLRVPEGSWIIRDTTVTISVIPNHRFKMQYEEAR